jgi:molecular chaperone GrpE
MNGSDDEIVSEEEAENPAAALKKLREKLSACVDEKKEYLDGWQRARADFLNYKREESSRRDEIEARLRSEFAEALIPALDSFEMAFKSPSFQSASQEWKAGMSGLYNELLKSLGRFGIISFSPVGEHFDPKEHEAVREVPVDSGEKEHTVVSVERSGYKAGERVIRPAQVSVGVHKK